MFLLNGVDMFSLRQYVFLKVHFNLFSLYAMLGLVVIVLKTNATFNTISVISWRSVLLVEETCRKSLTNFTT